MDGRLAYALLKDAIPASLAFKDADSAKSVDFCVLLLVSQPPPSRSPMRHLITKPVEGFAFNRGGAVD
jgi:hypothetical protein